MYRDTKELHFTTEAQSTLRKKAVDGLLMELLNIMGDGH